MVKIRPTRSASHSAKKTGLYSKALQLLINLALLHIPPPILESQFEFQQTCISDMDMIRAHQIGDLHWALNVTG